MCGIFGYLNFNRSRTRREILQTLLNGLKRLEYRGYDSAGKIEKNYLSHFTEGNRTGRLYKCSRIVLYNII